ncbi:MAG TPA: AAA family ATPase, partial [Actinocrinis sp.]
MTDVVARQRGGPAPRPVARDVSSAGGLLDRDDLLRLLDRAVAKPLTVVSAPPGSGKTSLLRAWAGRSAKARRVAFVSVERDQQNERRFWCAVLDAVRDAALSTACEPSSASASTAEADVDVDQVIDGVLAQIATYPEPAVLIIDDLHELRSTEALTQLERLIANLPGTARVVLSSRRDPPIRLHRFRLADAIAEIRAGDLRFTEAETRELLAGSAIGLS